MREIKSGAGGRSQKLKSFRKNKTPTFEWGSLTKLGTKLILCLSLHKMSSCSHQLISKRFSYPNSQELHNS